MLLIVLITTMLVTQKQDYFIYNVCYIHTQQVVNYKNWDITVYF